ncbi:MAG: tetratricopeptide repeat protein [Burkholderiales bacterium]|nr:tetratricopeptide repeat protein [Burkholderiales bacterium]
MGSVHSPAARSLSADERFRRLAALPDERIDLIEGALLIAKCANADVDIEHYADRMEVLAQQLRERVREDDSNAARIGALNRFLFQEQGFGPNAEDYYDPRNSYLNEVLERRIGIPITLSILYMELGRRIGLPLQGVPFPGHFLVKCPLDEGLVVLDPFSGGASLTVKDLQERLREVRGGEVSRAIVVGMLGSATSRQILGRMLRNLKSIHLEKEDYLRALPLMHWLLMLTPDDAGEVRDRGMAYGKLECFRAAVTDLEKYLALSPGAGDLEEVRGQLIDLRRSAARLN